MFSTNEGRLIFTYDAEQLCIEPWGNNAVRVRATKMAAMPQENWALLPRPDIKAKIETSESAATLMNGIIKVAVSKRGKIIISNNRTGKILLEEFVRDRRDVLDPKCSALEIEAREFKPILGGDYQLIARFESLDPKERIYGMGQYQQPYLDIKGTQLELAHRNSQASIPFAVSSRGYGLLWNNPSIGNAVFGKNVMSFEAQSTKALDYWVVASETPAEIVRSYADATGKAPMMPEYGLGFWQCKLRYQTQDELLEVAREYRRRELPIDLIVIDFFHWPLQGDWRFDEKYWPDPDAMVKELKELKIELMISIWPTVDRRSENYEEMVEKGLLIQTERGVRTAMTFQGQTIHFDPTNPAARDYVWHKAKKNYYEKGIKVFWLDEAEPEYRHYDFDNYRYHMGPNVAIDLLNGSGNIFPKEYARAYYEGMEAAGQKNIVNLIRCAWAGSQKYGALVWSGDISSTWSSFRNQLAAGLNMGLSGVPWWTTDIGGFHGGDPNDEAFRELFLRWFQWGTFCPVMRLHGDREPRQPKYPGSPGCRSGADNEVWSYGPAVYEICKKYMLVREEMREYTRVLMEEAHRLGSPIMRTLFYEFPEDQKCWEVEDQYMYGDKYLTCFNAEAPLQAPLIATLMSIVTFSHGFVLPPPTGFFNVGSKAYVLRKLTLDDPVAPNGFGASVLLNIYYPTEQKAPPSKYIWAGLSNLYDTHYHLGNGTFHNITARTSYNAEPLPLKEWKKLDLPTLIFSPPFAGPPSQVFHGLISNLVSHGYSVVTMDHPYEQPYLQLPDGTGILGLPFDYDINTEEGLQLVHRVHEYRLTDAHAVLEAMPSVSKNLSIPLNLTHFSFFGHSLGGSAALSQILYERNRKTTYKHRILGALNMDGSLWDPVAANEPSVDLRIPSLILSSAYHRGDPQFAHFDAQQSTWAKEINIGGKSNHTDFSDLIVVKQGLGISGGEGAIGCNVRAANRVESGLTAAQNASFDGSCLNIDAIRHCDNVMYIEPTQIYMHTDFNESEIRDAGEQGDRWTKAVINTFANIITWNYVDVPNFAGQNQDQKISAIQHKSDFIRWEAIAKTGGIYMDWDVVPLRPLTPLLNAGFAFIGGRHYGGADERGGINGTINNGVFLTKPNSAMARIVVREQHAGFDGKWEANLQSMTKIAERLVPIPNEVLILDRTAFAPTHWFKESTDPLFKPNEGKPSPAPHLINSTDPMELYDNAVMNRRRRAQWEMDFSSTYMLHAFALHEYYEFVNPKTILSRTSNFGVATYDIVRHMVDQGYISGDEEDERTNS
ncbi:glycoside hydrolase family 31 protein [Stemphylium lycopersici]|uniref:Glycoside hydrolase family 31 protein n=1 Tax=Stemphylium lycopersici TaxID=183478 RepID=A0A364MVW0_STELY|nr:glycoside hydrolase family 31 protein [Stemphylium lycopersici]RAR05068.1 glycoside hydrolase family 31 protein [Stemphylium lycopersici]